MEQIEAHKSTTTSAFCAEPFIDFNFIASWTEFGDIGVFLSYVLSVVDELFLDNFYSPDLVYRAGFYCFFGSYSFFFVH